MHTPAGLVGDTSVPWIDTPFTASERSFWTRLEGQDPGGVKDRTALYVVSAARARGLLPGARVVESASGTLSAPNHPGIPHLHPSRYAQTGMITDSPGPAVRSPTGTA